MPTYQVFSDLIVRVGFPIAVATYLIVYFCTKFDRRLEQIERIANKLVESCEHIANQLGNGTTHAVRVFRSKDGVDEEDVIANNDDIVRATKLGESIGRGKRRPE